jgi:hypothetical protein
MNYLSAMSRSTRSTVVDSQYGGGALLRAMPLSAHIVLLGTVQPECEVCNHDEPKFGSRAHTASCVMAHGAINQA